MDIPSKRQTTIHVGLEKTNEKSIQRSNDAELEKSIADYFHYKNISDQIVESTWFSRMIDLARLRGKGFKLPTQKIRGEFTFLLLYLHYTATKILFFAIRGEILNVNSTSV